LPRVFGIDVSQVSLLIGTVIGSALSTGSVAIFNLAVNIESVPIGVIAIPFALAAFPALAETVANDNNEKFLSTLSFTVRQILFFLIPISLLTIVLRAHIVRLIIGTRQLSWDDTRLAAAALGIFALSFVLQGLTPLFSRAFYAIHDTVRPVIASLISIIVNVGGTLFFTKILASNSGLEIWLVDILRLQGISDLRVLALPIGFALASLVNLVILIIWLRKIRGPMLYGLILWRFTKMLIAGVLAAAATYGTLQLMVPLVNTRTFFGILGQLSVSSLIGLLVYIVVSLLFRSKEMWQFLRSIQSRVVALIGPIDLSGTEEM